jgi:outer membrane protein assembly factor BamB
LHRFLVALGLIGALVVTGGCSTSRGSQSVTPPAAASPLSPIGRIALTDDWFTMGRDYTRTAFQTQNTGITTSNVAKLRLRWKARTGRAMYTAPLVYAGNVVIASLGALGGHPTLYDYRPTDGTLLWKLDLAGEEVRAPPSIDPAQNVVIVATRNWRYAKGAYLTLPGTLYAIDLVTGKPHWSRWLPQASTQPGAAGTHGSVVVAGGKIFIGTSGGDEPQCSNGGVTAFDEATGAMIWKWRVNTTVDPKGGGSVWGTIAYDGTHLIFGTGNTCGPTHVTTANGAVALDLHGNVVWNFVAVQNSAWDDDTGGGVVLSNGNAMFVNKNGTLYDLKAATGTEVWNRPLGAADGFGGFATPATDGTTTVVGAGQFRDQGRSMRVARETAGLNPARPVGAIAPGFHSFVKAVDAAGAVIWQRQTSSNMTGMAAIVSGIAFVGLGNTMSAVDLQTGKTLWHYASSVPFDPSPAIVPSGVYAADDAGTIYAFALP